MPRRTLVVIPGIGRSLGLTERIMASLSNREILDMCHLAAEQLRRIDQADPAKQAAMSQLIQRLEHPDRLHDSYYYDCVIKQQDD